LSPLNDSLENDSNDNFKAAIDRLLANCAFTQMAAAVTACLRKMYADGDTNMSPDIIAKADAARTFLENAARGQRPWLTEQEECAEPLHV
jgi:hypothetical protein